MIQSEIISVTPEMAAKWLAESNVRNRKLRDDVAQRYARDMLRGEWTVGSDSIAFDVNGALVNGQHRLKAVTIANIPVDMLITKGLPAESIIGIDQGLRRKFEDNLRMQDINAPSSLLKQRVVPAARALMYMEMSHFTMSSNEVVWMYKNFKDEFEATDRLTSPLRTKSTNRWFHAAILAAVIAGEKYEAMSAFVDTYSKYENSYDYNIQAALNWRATMDSAKNKTRMMSGSAIYRGTEVAIWNYINNGPQNIRIPDKSKYQIRDKLIKAIQR